jgi:hypothetical protein
MVRLSVREQVPDVLMGPRKRGTELRIGANPEVLQEGG